ncbi:transcriptional regulator family: Fungal Specific TF [Penicillium psychrosexuale]|uniref:transcriptional regulator family: Fungal Specific TF n=1 Tax=Penicillium psychrosexuale TaxID=1002107 RepID=UPI0025453938|nr:transcriptional regulator family: Fungal Specific TF [Penicillium psychrosexuale]KAJ5788962.1 transcriptional regulator family: Fungal Specific TF [Penicillium psychrosexuale]
MFRDESKSVIRKAVAASTHRKRVERSRRSAIPERNPVRSGLSTAPVGQVLDFHSDPQHINLMRQLGNRPVEVQPSQEFETTKNEAICFFLRSTAIPGSFLTTEMISDSLVQSGGTPSHRAMKASVVATAMAMLSRVRGLPSLRDVAYREYGSALRLLNAALTDMEEAKSNQTLGAVMLLAKYEVISSRAPKEIESWTNHISGAMALLDLRGADKLKTDTDLRLFLYLRYQITISCLQRDVRVPESLIEQTEIAMILQPEQVHGNRLLTIIGKLSNLRADICANMYNEQEIISAASAIEASLIAWLAALPPEFNYTTHRLRGITPYDDQYHMYSSAWVCHSWNQYRSARIIVSEIILSRVRRLSDSSSMTSLSEELRIQCRTLRSTIRRLAVDICRSVPFHFIGYQVDRVSSLPPPEHYVAGLMLLWHLFVAGVVENPQHRLRRWVVKCLQMIGNTMGIDQALAVADIVADYPGALRSVTEEEDSHSSDQDLTRRDLVTHSGNTCLGVYSNN